MDKKKICCAIYTRKSFEDSLEQNFNSLGAQKVQMLFESKIKTKTDKYFSKCQLYHLFANKVYEEEYKAVICYETFEKVQNYMKIKSIKLVGLNVLLIPFLKV